MGIGEVIHLLVTAIISTVALVISVQNRRNSHRETLYKEQITAFIKISLSREKIDNLLIDISCIYEAKGEILQEYFDELNDGLEDFDLILTSHSFLFNDKLAQELSSHTGKLWRFNKSISNGDYANTFDKKMEDSLYEDWMDVEDILRDAIGVEALSDDTKRIVSRNRDI